MFLGSNIKSLFFWIKDFIYAVVFNKDHDDDNGVSSCWYHLIDIILYKCQQWQQQQQQQQQQEHQ